MAEEVTSAMAQAFSLGASYACTTSDSRGAGVTRTFNPSGVNWYRIFLCIVAGTGTDHLDPKEFLGYVRSVLGSAFWNVEMTVEGLVKITYLSTGTGTITWGVGARLIRNILGFAGDIGPLAQNASATAPGQPTHFLRIFSLQADTNWSAEFAGIASLELPDNSVDVISDGYQKIRRSYTLRFHPRTSVEAAALPSNGTPAWPADASMTRILTPSSDPLVAPSTGSPIVWSIHEFISTAMGQAIGVTHGDFQRLVAGSATSFDVCFFAPKTAEGRFVHSTAYYAARVDRQGVEVLLYSRASIA